MNPYAVTLFTVLLAIDTLLLVVSVHAFGALRQARAYGIAKIAAIALQPWVTVHNRYTDHEARKPLSCGMT